MFFRNSYELLVSWLNELFLILFAKNHPLQDRHIEDLLKYGTVKERRGKYVKIRIKRRQIYKVYYKDEYAVQVRTQKYYWVKVEGAGIGSLKGYRHVPNKELQARLLLLCS